MKSEDQTSASVIAYNQIVDFSHGVKNASKHPEHKAAALNWLETAAPGAINELEGVDLVYGLDWLGEMAGRNNSSDISKKVAGLIGSKLGAIEGLIKDENTFSELKTRKIDFSLDKPHGRRSLPLQEILLLASKQGDKTGSRYSKRIMADHLESLAQLGRSDSSFDLPAHLVNFGDADQATKAEQYLTQRFDTRRSFYEVMKLIDSLNRAGKISSRRLAESFSRQLLQQMGINADHISKIWRNGGYYEKRDMPLFDGKYSRNMTAMIRLENKHPGSSAALYNRFGIRHFRRYDHELLAKQFDNIDRDEPYGLIISAHADHNGTFSQYYQERELSKLFEHMPQSMLLRVAEVGNKRELAALIYRLRRFYPKHWPEFVIAAGHGNWNSISVGSGESQVNSLTHWDIQSTRASEFLEFLKHSSSVILNSCLTGRAYGLAQTLSEKIPGRVIANSETFSQAHFQVYNTQISGIYIDASFNRGQKIVYQNGRRIFD